MSSTTMMKKKRIPSPVATSTMLQFISFQTLLLPSLYFLIIMSNSFPWWQVDAFSPTPWNLHLRRNTSASSFPSITKEAHLFHNCNNSIGKRMTSQSGFDKLLCIKMSSNNNGESRTSATKKRSKRKNGGNSGNIANAKNTNKNDRTRMKMKTDELNNLVRGIGLTPVVKEPATNTEAKKKNKNNKKIHNNDHNANNSLNSNSPFLNINDANNVQVPIETQLQYSRNGHAVLRNMIPLDVINTLRSVLVQHASVKSLDAWRQKVEVATNSASIASSCQTIEECQYKLMQLNNDGQVTPPTLPFLQHFNTWRTIDAVRNFVTSPLMAKTAQQLLDVPSVKLYQDSLFWKRFNDGPTPWHSDARMAPFDTSHMITFWIPLQYIPKPEKGGTGLWFVDKSHADFALPYWNHNTHHENDDSDSGGGTSNNNDNSRNHRYNHREYERLEERYGGNNGINHHMPLQMGDCTVHAGWTLHCSDAGTAITTPTNIDDSSLGATASSSKDRFALAVTYVDARAEIRHDVLMDEEDKEGMIKDGKTKVAGSASLGDNEDRWSFQDWVREVKPREYFKHDLVPIVWPTSSSM